MTREPTSSRGMAKAQRLAASPPATVTAPAPAVQYRLSPAELKAKQTRASQELWLRAARQDERVAAWKALTPAERVKARKAGDDGPITDDADMGTAALAEWTAAQAEYANLDRSAPAPKTDRAGADLLAAFLDTEHGRPSFSESS